MHRYDAWLIGMVRSESFEGIRDGLSSEPIFTPQAMAAWNGYGAADPFAIWVKGVCYVFFEMLVRGQSNAVIAVAFSSDLKNWTLGGIVLQERHHLSYPFVFEYGGDWYMMPESKSQRRVDLYRAVEFPMRWERVSTLLHGRYMDATLVEHAGRYWMFAGWHSYWMRLFYADSPLGPWKAHWQPVARFYSKLNVRPGGRPVRVGKELVRFAQDNRKCYGHQLRAMRIDKLNRLWFREREWRSNTERSLGGNDDPFLSPRTDRWYSRCLHHLDIAYRNEESGGGAQGKRWIGFFDGY